MEIQACIFDLDGVLVDTARYHFLAWRRLANELGFDFTEADNERLKGVSRMKSLDIILELGGVAMSEQEKAAGAARKNDWYLSYVGEMTPAEILPGVLAFLEDLQRQGIRIALGSASKNARTILERVGLTAFFDAIVDGTMVHLAKPDPEVFLKGAGLLGLAPGGCIVFEDAQAGVEAARRAGMYVIGIGEPDILNQAHLTWPDLSGRSSQDLMLLQGIRL